MSETKLKDKLIDYYKKEDNLLVLFNVINKKSKYSLRVIEWFVTNYCKKHLVVYQVNGKQFNVYKKYKDTLKSYTKEKFDPFKRTKQNNVFCKKLKLKNNLGESIETTLCQMNFFKWLISNNVHKYIEANIDLIKQDMNNALDKKKISPKAANGGGGSSSKKIIAKKKKTLVKTF